jgi:hypothetical protein
MVGSDVMPVLSPESAASGAFATNDSTTDGISMAGRM